MPCENSTKQSAMKNYNIEKIQKEKLNDDMRTQIMTL